MFTPAQTAALRAIGLRPHPDAPDDGRYYLPQGPVAHICVGGRVTGGFYVETANMPFMRDRTHSFTDAQFDEVLVALRALVGYAMLLTL